MAERSWLMGSVRGGRSGAVEMCKAWMFTGITNAAREIMAKAFTPWRGRFTHVLEFGGNGPMQEGEIQHTRNVVCRQLG